MNERETDSITEDMKVRVTRMRVNHGNSSVVHRGNPCDTVCDTYPTVFFFPSPKTDRCACTSWDNTNCRRAKTPFISARWPGQRKSWATLRVSIYISR